jgi:UDP-hydrolysing UDP-N-acetyl-D-glucosamine 2-epimerase
MRKRICVVTGSRADYGLLVWVLHDLHAAPDVELQLIVTGMHLSPEFGSTVRQIEADGFTITRRVEMLLSSDTPSGVAKSIGLGVIGMADALSSLAPEVLVVLGDRFEILAAVQAALVQRIPVVHIAGGDLTLGAFDESVRHAITKMAHVHLVTNDQSARKVRQLGENPQRIHVVGSPGIDYLSRERLLPRAELAAALARPLAARNLLITFHPVTLEPDDGEHQLYELLAALQAIDTDIQLWFTLPNADTGGRRFARWVSDWVVAHSERACVHTSLGQLLYLSLMSQVDGVVGNSSSGLYEAPSFGVPTVDIGDRQAGRLAAASVIRCAPQREAIGTAIRQALTLGVHPVVNPYGDGHAAERIVAILRDLPPADQLLKKTFHLLESESP